MDDARPQSLFVVLHYVGLWAPYSSSIVLLDKNANNLQYAAAHLTSEGRPKIKRSSSLSSLDTHQNQKECGAHLTSSEDLREMKRWYSRWCSTYSLDLQKDYVAHIAVPPGYPLVTTWTFCTPTISADLCGQDLCVVPDSGSPHLPIDAQLKGFLFNLRTKNFKSFQPPISCPYYDYAVAVGEHIYFLTDHFFNRKKFFKRYDPVNDFWKILEPFPRNNYRSGGVLASAVLDDTIVLNVLFEFWAYSIGRNKWYQVCVDDTDCYGIFGVAVVLNNTIYALTTVSCDLVLALSIEKKEINDDLEFYCSPPSRIVLPGMKENEIVNKESPRWESPRWEPPGWESRHLVHLGEDNFCLVQSSNTFCFIDYQSIQVTYLKLKRGENLMMIVTGTFIYKLKILQKEQFNISVCFSLPDSKAAALKEGKGSIFTFNPYPEDYLSEQKDKNQEAEVPEVSTPPDEYLPPRNADVVNNNVKGHYVYPVDYVLEQKDKNQEAEVPEVSTPPDEYLPPRNADVVNNNVKGHYIYVRNLVKKANVKMVELRLKKFGAIKRDGIQVLKNKKGCYAFVEFECAASKQLAIEASPIMIGGCSAQILEKRASKKRKNKRKEMNRVSV